MSREGGRVKRKNEAVRGMTEHSQDPKTPPQPKPQERDTVRREIDRIARQLDGLSKSLKRLKEAT